MNEAVILIRLKRTEKCRLKRYDTWSFDMLKICNVLIIAALKTEKNII